MVFGAVKSLVKSVTNPIKQITAPLTGAFSNLLKDPVSTTTPFALNGLAPGAEPAFSTIISIAQDSFSSGETI
ncbi:MAG: hypothetical protein SFT81_00880 [Candidatus Caenarcaniphilales bacterium]|nr:hypothetical protein [Candidatus Caenarcaniphilales bacterium]